MKALLSGSSPAHTDTQTEHKMAQPKTTYDVKRLSLEEIRAWLLIQNAKLPPSHRRDRAAETTQAAKIRFSQASASSKSTGCIPFEDYKKPTIDLETRKKLGLAPAVELTSDGTSSEYDSYVAPPTSSSTRSQTPKREQQIRDANNSTISSALMHSMESASRFSKTAMPAAREFVSTKSLTPPLTSLGSSSGPSTPKSLDEPLECTCSLPSDQIHVGAETSLADSEVWQSKSKESSYLPSASSSDHIVPKPWEMSYDVVSGKPITLIFPPYSSASLAKPNSYEPLPIDTHNSLSLEPEGKLPSAPSPIPATLSINKHRKAVEEQRERLLSNNCMLSPSEGSQQQPLMPVDNELHNMQAEIFSSRSGEETIRESTQKVLNSAFQIIHPWELHETGISQVVDEHCDGREQEFLIDRSKVPSVHVASAKPDSPRKAGSEKGEENRAACVLQLTRRATAPSRVSNRSLSPPSSTSSSSSSSSSANSSNSTCTSVTSSSSDALNPLQWRGQTWAILACIAAIFSIFLVANYKQYLEEHERQTYWWT